MPASRLPSPSSARFGLAGAVAAVCVTGVATGLLAGGDARGGRATAPQRPAAALRPALGFEANRGQAPRGVAFLAHGDGYALGLGTGSVRLALGRPGASAAGLRLTTPGGRLGTPLAQRALPGKVNYLIGADRSRWLRNVPTYGRVAYRQVWPGIDLAFQGTSGRLEYDFDVAPHADASHLALALPGARSLTPDGRGGVVVSAGHRRLRMSAPVAYQDGADGRDAVRSRLVIAGRRIRVVVGRYDHDLPLVVDPVFAFSSFVGGKYSVAVGVGADASSDVYVAGIAAAGGGLATSPGVAQPTYGGGNYDAFVEKLNPSGTAVLYATYLGGPNYDTAFALAVDGAGDAYVTGTTNKYDSNGQPLANAFPTTSGALQRTYGGGDADAYIAKLNPTGSALVYSTLLGGSGQDGLNAIAIGSDGSAYVTGNVPGYQGCGSLATGKLNPAGSAITYWKCDPSAVGLAVAVDGAGDAYVSGRAVAGMATTSGVVQPAYSGGQYDIDGFAEKLDPAGSQVWQTYLGGPSRGGNLSTNTNGNGVAVDGSGNVYVAGFAKPGFQTTTGAFQTADNGDENAFVLKLNPTATAYLYSTYLGGSGNAVGKGVAVDAAGHAYVTGEAADGYPVTPGAAQTSFGGDAGDAFITELATDGKSLAYSTYLGGIGQDSGNAIALVPNGNVAIAGGANTAFPVTEGAADTTSGGAFAAELGAPVAGGGGTTTTTGATTTAGTMPTSTPPTATAPGFIETLTTSKGTTITIKTAQGEEPYAELDKHLLGGLSGDDMARLLANGGFSVQIPLTYPAYAGDYSASGSATPSGIPGYDGQGVGSASLGDSGDPVLTRATRRAAAGAAARRRAPKAVTIFKYAHTYKKAGTYTAKIRLTTAGRKLLLAANHAHKSLKLKLRLTLKAKGRTTIDRRLSKTLKPGKRVKAKR